MPMQRPNTNRRGMVRSEPAPRRLTHLILAAGLLAATFAAYAPAILAGFIWDDDRFLYQSPIILAPDGLYRTWFTTEASDYWPLTRTMFWLEWRIWGNNPMPYHVGNILIHAVAAVLLWRVLRWLNVNPPGAYLAGLIFAVHPVTIESVAWIAERKNVLSMALYLLAILAYLRFHDQRCRRWYVFALLAAAAALLAKTSVVMLPVVLLLLIGWKQGAIARRDLVRTAPFFLVSLALGLLTIWYQHQNVISGVIVRPEGLASRIASVGWVVWFYLYKIVVPMNLAMVYPRWDVDGGRVLSFVPLGLLIACFVVLGYYRRGWGRAPLAALGSFVIVLAPVLGLLEMAYARYSLVADHLQYPGMPGIIALLGGCLGAAWLRARATGRGAVAVGLAAAAGAVAIALGAMTWRQAQTYRNAETLWSHTIAINDHAWVAYNNRGNAYSDKHDHDRAIRDYTRAIELKPNYADAYYNRGCDYHRLSDFGQAIRDYTKTIELKKNSTDVYNNLAVAYFNLREYDKAWADVAMFRQLGGTPHPDFLQALTEATGRSGQRRDQQ